MTNFENIISFINTTLKTAQFSTARFQKGQYIDSVVELVKSSENGETTPAVINNNGTTTKITPNDVYPFQIYHRMLSANYELVENDFAYRTRRTIANMTLVAIGDRERLELTKDDIILALSWGMPLELPAANKTALSIESCNITPNNFITDFADVWNREFNIETNELKTNTILIALDYTITLDVKEGCLNVCS